MTMTYELLNQNQEYKNIMIEMIVSRDFAGIVRKQYLEGEVTTQELFDFIDANIEKILRFVFDKNEPATIAIAKLYIEQA
jgi:hypothetical protein